MNFWNNNNEDEKPTDRLERDPLSLSFTDAQAEYFADMAFDVRLVALLEKKAIPVISIDLTFTTTACNDGLTSTFFEPNTTVEDDEKLSVTDAYVFHLSGSLKQEADKLIVDARVDSELGDYTSVRIQSDNAQPDCYFISKEDDEFDFSILDSKELFTVLCRLGNVPNVSIGNYMASVEGTADDAPLAFESKTNILWNQLGETYGKTKTVNEVIHEVVKPINTDFPEKIKLRHEEFENPDATIIKLFLEHSTDMSEFDVQESYCLSLIFEQINGKSAHAGAEKVIVSGISPKLIGLDVYKKSQGRVMPLDINNEIVKGLFVDWFDQIVTAK